MRGSEGPGSRRMSGERERQAWKWWAAVLLAAVGALLWLLRSLTAVEREVPGGPPIEIAAAGERMIEAPPRAEPVTPAQAAAVLPEEAARSPMPSEEIPDGHL